MTGAAPLPGGALPIRDWEAALDALATSDEDARVQEAQALLARLEDALADL